MKFTFERMELKYLITPEQLELIKAQMSRYMAMDQYGITIIRNLYLDTDNYRLIRRSIEKPAYKEKIRLRSYSAADPNDEIFVEIKKKYQGVVYKRRMTMPQQAALTWLSGDHSQIPDTQIAAEIDYFSQYYGDLRPVIFLSYRRQAWYSLDGSDFRVTFDDDILCRQDRLSLSQPPGGISILPEGFILMEIKTAGGIPLWMVNLLSREKIFKTSYSKYGTAYQHHILPNAIQEGVFHHDFSRNF